MCEISESQSDEVEENADDRLRLIFTCCHPSLPMHARVALTLRTIAGLNPAQIAHAFLVTEPTMKKRLVRARAKIRNAGIPYRVLPANRLAEGREGVLAVLYLLFTECYSATEGDSIIRRPLLVGSIRLSRTLVEPMPADAESCGLLALMLLLQHARSDARTDTDGELVTVENQDRSLWDPLVIDGVLEMLGSLPTKPGRYELQARIAVCRAIPPTPASTDFERIAKLYS